MRIRLTLLLSIYALLAAFVSGQTIPAGGTSFFSGNPPSAFGIRSADTSTNAFSTVAVTGQSFTSAWRIETSKNVANPWGIEVNAKIPLAVANTGVGFLHFWARATVVTDQLAIGRVTLVVQKAGANYDKSLFQEVSISGQWAEYFVPFQMGASYAANGAEICLDVGYKIQTLEIGAFEAVYYSTARTLAEMPQTKLTYPGEEDGAPWRTAALARIETIRKGNFSVHVTDAAGSPLAGVPVHIEMTKHAFPFGTPISFQFLNTDTPANRIYQRKFLELFNAGSSGNDLKWPPWMGDWGPSMTHAQAFYGIKWMHDRGLRLRGHVMVWPGWSELPNFIQNLKGTTNESTIPQKVLEHINEMAAFTRGYTQEWDVINEPFLNHALMDLFGQKIMLDWFNAAHEGLPGVELYLNDWNNHDDQAAPDHVQNNIDHLTYLVNNHAPITGVGIQAHIGGNPNAPVNVLSTFDRYAALGLKLRITEFDVNTKDTALQADYTRDFLIACFSHPNVNGFQMWGFWETDHWIPDASMYKPDFTEKPNAVAYKKLVFNDWWTAIDATTDSSGNITGRGFYGDYKITYQDGATRSEKTFKMRAGEAAPAVTLSTLPPRMVNLSTRSRVGKVEGPAISGLAITGTQSKKILVRAVGPTLTVFGITNPLAHPHLELRDEAGALLASNDGWDKGNDPDAMKQTFGDAGAFNFTTGSADCALVATLPPGRYTALGSSVGDEAGVLLMEAYEVDHTGDSHMVNLSNRSFVGTGENVAISGFVVTGSNARTFLVRAVGPGLEPFNIANRLARPTVSVYSGQDPIAGNAIWSTHAFPDRVAKAISDAGAFPLAADSTDAALLVTLEPGNYTLVTAGSDDGSGTAIVEVYEVTK